MENVVKTLEKNSLNVCNPHLTKNVSRYPKISYKLPAEIYELMREDDDQWTNILEKVNILNIHLSHEQSVGLESLNEKSDNLAMRAVRIREKKDDLMLLSGGYQELSEKALKIPLHSHFEALLMRADEVLKVPVNLRNMQAFHMDGTS